MNLRPLRRLLTAMAIVSGVVLYVVIIWLALIAHVRPWALVVLQAAGFLVGLVVAALCIYFDPPRR